MEQVHDQQVPLPLPPPVHSPSVVKLLAVALLCMFVIVVVFTAGNVTAQKGIIIPLGGYSSVHAPMVPAVSKMPSAPTQKSNLQITGIYETDTGVVVFVNKEAYATLYTWLQPGVETQSFLPFGDRFESGFVITKGIGYRIKAYETQADPGTISKSYIFKGNRSVIENPDCPYEQFVAKKCGVDTEKVSADAEKNNAKRLSDLNSLMNAVKQYEADNKGQLPATISEIAVPIRKDAVDFCTLLVPRYLASLPVDPTINNGVPIFSAKCSSDYDTGYTIQRNKTTDALTLTTPNAELGATISLTR